MCAAQDEVGLEEVDVGEEEHHQNRGRRTSSGITEQYNTAPIFLTSAFARAAT